MKAAYEKGLNFPTELSKELLSRDPVRYDALTGVRFFAAFGVFIAHFGHFDFGSQGVSLFFVLSGFILSKVYTQRKSSSGKFYWARFARIYPAYFFSLIIALPVYWNLIRTHEHPFWFMVSVIGLVHAWDPSTAHLWNNPSWSLSAEALFYFVFPFVLPWSNIRLRYLIAAVLVLWAWQTWVQVTGDYTDGGQFIAKLPLLRLPEFLIGIAFGRIHEKVSMPWALPVSFSLIIIAALFMPTWGTHTALAPLYGLLFIGLTTNNGILASKPMVLLGESSYSFYLYHMPVMVWVNHLGPIPLLFKVPLLFALTQGLSLLSLFMIERPARTWLLARYGAIFGPSIRS